jgi:hypothetical protein
MAQWGSFAEGLAGGIVQGQQMGFKAQQMAMQAQQMKMQQMQMDEMQKDNEVKQDISSYAKGLYSNPDYAPQTTPQTDFESGQTANVTRPALKNPENDVLAYGIKAYNDRGMLKQAQALGDSAIQRFTALSSAAKEVQDPALQSKLILEGLVAVAPLFKIPTETIRQMQSGDIDSKEMTIVNTLGKNLNKIAVDLANPKIDASQKAALYMEANRQVDEAKAQISTKRKGLVDSTSKVLGEIYKEGNKTDSTKVQLVGHTPDNKPVIFNPSTEEQTVDGQTYTGPIQGRTTEKTPNEIELIQRAQAGDQEAAATLRQLQANKINITVAGSAARGKAYADERFYEMYDTKLAKTIRVKGYALNGDIENGTNRYVTMADPVLKADVGSLAKLTKGMDAVGAFDKGATAALTYAESVAKDYGAGQFPGANKLTQLFQYHMGNEKVEGLKNSITTAATEYMKVINAGSDLTAAELSVMGQQRAKEIIEANDNIPSLMNSMKIMKKEMAISSQKFKDQQAEVKGRLKNYGSSGAVETPPTAAPTLAPTHKYIPGQGIVAVGGP